MSKLITKEIMDKAYQLYLDGKNYKEISLELGIGLSSVKSKLKKDYNVQPMKDLPVIDWRVFKPLWDSNLSNNKIAEKLNLNVNVVSKFKKLFYNYSINSATQNIINKIEQFTLGSLLGDLFMSSPNSKNECRLAIVHTKEQEQLFMSAVEILGDKMGSYKLRSYLDDRTNKEYFTYRGNSKYDSIFKSIWDLTYSNNGKKLVTKEWLDKIDSPLALAYWFMDDGTHRGTIATNGFSEAEIDLLIDWMKSKWGIICTKQQNVQSTIQYVIHISSHSRYNFEQLIFPYVVPSMYYKLKYANNLIENTQSV